MNFYCQNKCGQENFNIDEWNKKFLLGLQMNLGEKEMFKLLDREDCIQQCFDCIAIVGETRIKNKNNGTKI